ncbi:MAG: PilT/PilU family type 4a pilus ATPase [Planctomycetaceae bacterium]|jgi:twitching motility protein PilT|nr:PilT/PilU family type 4a pilus ATPase [Planctomycetaceae bacterium]
MLSGSMTIQRLMGAMRKLSASDLHIKVGIPPTYRINGTLRPINADALSEDEADHLLDPIIPERLKSRFETTGDLDFATYDELGDRYRVNMYRAGNHVHAAIRRVKADIPNFEALHLPPIYRKLAEETNEGLILIVGVTGSGKSSTAASMIDHINATRAENIISVEDPVEFRFTNKKSIVSQREIGIDVADYKSALRYIVRQDPDVIFIGEMRDHDTVLAAIQAAETGHLVFASMHTADTSQSFSRILEFFPIEEHGFIRSAMSSSLKAICAQRLLPAAEGFVDEEGKQVGIVPATEVLINTPIVRDRIKEGQDGDFPAIINSSIPDGMRSFTYSLAELVKEEKVAKRVAMEYAPNRDALDSAIKGVQVKTQMLVGKIKG